MKAVAFGIVYLFIEALQVVYGSYWLLHPTNVSGLHSSQYRASLPCFSASLRPRNDCETKVARPVVASKGYVGWLGNCGPRPCNCLVVVLMDHTTSSKAPWIMSMIAFVPIGFAVNEFDCVLEAYKAETVMRCMLLRHSPLSKFFDRPFRLPFRCPLVRCM